jgi:hypothetical protein
MPGIGWHTVREDSDAISILLFEANNPSGAWAACAHEPGARESAVTQYGCGPGRGRLPVLAALWDPGPERHGITVDPVGTRIWLDNPRNLIGPPAGVTVAAPAAQGTES